MIITYIYNINYLFLNIKNTFIFTKKMKFCGTEASPRFLPTAKPPKLNKGFKKFGGRQSLAVLRGDSVVFPFSKK